MNMIEQDRAYKEVNRLMRKHGFTAAAAHMSWGWDIEILLIEWLRFDAKAGKPTS